MIGWTIVGAYVLVGLLVARLVTSFKRDAVYEEWKAGHAHFAQPPRYVERDELNLIALVLGVIGCGVLWPLFLVGGCLVWFVISKPTAYDRDVAARKRDQELTAREAEVARKEREIEEWKP